MCMRRDFPDVFRQAVLIRSEPSEFEIGYLMGLAVGEGSFTGGEKEPCFAIKLQTGDPEPLEDAQNLLGGVIFGPYLHEGRHYRYLLVRGNDLERALPLFERFLPTSRKRRQFEQWLERWSSYFSHCKVKRERQREWERFAEDPSTALGPLLSEVRARRSLATLRMENRET